MKVTLAFLFFICVLTFAKTNCGIDRIIVSNKQSIPTNVLFKKKITKYVIKEDYDLKGNEIIIPEGCTLIFEGGSFSNGTLRLSDNVTIEGNGSKCIPLSNKDENNNITNKTFIYADGVKNITIRNISLVGSYDESMGNLPFKNKRLTNSEHLIYIGNCTGVKISGLTISNFYSNKVRNEWFEVYSSQYGLYPILIHNSKDIIIERCKQVKSAGEAWNIFYSKNITVDSTIFDSQYGVSFLTIMYCDHVTVQKSQFIRRTAFKYDTGNLVNIFSSNVTFTENIVDGGDYDWGNEHVNCRATEKYLHNNFVVNNIIISHNTFKSGKVTNNTAIPKQGELPKYIVKNIVIKDNIFENTLMGVSFGARGGIREASITSNSFKCFSNDELTKSSRFQVIVAYNTCPDELVISDNIIHCSDTVFNYSFNGPLGAILINKGKKIHIFNNIIQAPFGIRYKGSAEMAVLENKIICNKPQSIDIADGNLDYSKNIIHYENNTNNCSIRISGKSFRYTGNIYTSKIQEKISDKVRIKHISDNVFNKE